MSLELAINEEEKARKQILNAGLILHFGGEFVGSLYFILGGLLPILKYHSIGWKNMAIGAGIYIATQVPALYMKGIAIGEEENYELAKYYANSHNEDKRKGLDFSSWADKQVVKMHMYFARNHEKYDRLVRKYIQLKQKFRGKMKI